MAKFWKKPNGQTNGWQMAAEVGLPFYSLVNKTWYWRRMKQAEPGEVGLVSNRSTRVLSEAGSPYSILLQSVNVIGEYWPREADLLIFQAKPGIYKSQDCWSQDKW